MDRLTRFFKGYKFLKYKKHEMILHAEDIPSGVYYLNKGYVRDYSLSTEGEELTLIIFKPEDFFPITWAINNTVNTHYFEAMTDVELLRAPREKFISFIKENPDVFFELTKRVLIRLSGMTQRMEYLAFGNAYTKVASILVILAARFGEKSGKNINVKLPLTHKDIAALVGITRETASIEIEKLEKKGIIEFKNRQLTVRNLKRLEKECNCK